MCTEPMTGYIKISIFCNEFLDWLDIYSLGNPSTGSWHAGWQFYCPPVTNQHRWETLPKWLPINSLYLGPVSDTDATV